MACLEERARTFFTVGCEGPKRPLTRRLEPADRRARAQSFKIVPVDIFRNRKRSGRIHPVGKGKIEPGLHADAHGGTETELTVTERARLKELERENQELRAETAFLKKAAAYFAREPR